MAKILKEDKRRLEKLRFKYQIINMIWKLTLKLDFKINYLKEENKKQREFILNKYR